MRFAERDQVSSVFFNQNGSYINVPTNSGLKPTRFFLGGWFCPSSIAMGGNHLSNIINTEQSNTGFALRIGNGIPNLFAGSGSGNATATAAGKMLTNAKWVHLMGGYDGTNVKLFLNNQEIASAALGSFSASDNDFRIGRAHLNSRDFNGYANDVFFLTDYPDAAQRAKIFQGILTPEIFLDENGEGDNPIGFYLKCNENTGTTPQDSSGNGNHGAFVSGSGAPAWSTFRRFKTRSAINA